MERNLRQNYNCLDSGKTYFYIIALGCVLSCVLVLLYMSIASIMGITYKELLSLRGIIYFGIIITPITYLTLFLVYHKRQHIVIFRKPKINVWYVLIAILFAGICLFAVAPITNWLSAIVEYLGVKSDPLSYTMNNWWQIILGIVGYAVLPALAEELLYRRVILEGFLTKHTARNAIIMVAIMFAIMHGSIKQIFYQLVLGFVLTTLAYVTSSVIYPMIMHFVNNLVVVVLSVTGGEWLVAGAGIPISIGGNIAIYAVLAMVALAGMFYVMHLIGKHNTSKATPQNIMYKEFHNFARNQDRQENYYFSLGMIVACVVWIINTISCFVA